jgi:D-alanyl-lipoteichoic acid acyltransferase DltB (MBOAT superfamily)
LIFPTIEFAAFFVVVLVGNWLLMPTPRAWKAFILVASYLFYGFAEWRYMALLAAMTAINQIAALGIVRAPSPLAAKVWLIGVVVADLGILGFFKYYDFFVTTVAELLGRFGLEAPLPLLQILLPVGISFYTFQALSYVVDVYRGLLRPASWADFAVYLAFFPQLVAGPIVRAREFLPQLATPRDPRRIPAVGALFLIAGGLVKKVLIADTLAVQVVDPVFAVPSAYSAPDVLLAIFAYALQIYCDFSAYTDIAIGVALLLGFRFPQNFDHPYRAWSVQDFWRRWHMTLSRWLRDYLYIPLGGNRGGQRRTAINLMLTMLLGGLWHGAAWTFVVWGGLHGAYLVAERAWASRRSRTGAAVPGSAVADVPVAERPLTVFGPLPRPLALVVTFSLVCLAWVFFRSDSFATAVELLSRLADPGAITVLSVAVVVALIAGAATHVVPRRTFAAIEAAYGRLPLLLQGLVAAVFLVAMSVATGTEGAAPFLYFQF